MTLQTSAPIEYTRPVPKTREVEELVGDIADGEIDLEPPYQRGPVWTEDQRIALIRSWLTGLPTGALALSTRDTPRWARANGDVYTTNKAIRAVIDGKQRLLAAQAWFADEAAVYVLVNGGGTPQADRDMERARQIAAQQP